MKLTNPMKKFVIILITIVMVKLMRAKEMHAINAVLSRKRSVTALITIVMATRMKI